MGVRTYEEWKKLRLLKALLEGDEMTTLKHVSDQLHDLRHENAVDHEEIKKKQDETNHDVGDLKLWKARVEGAFWATKANWGAIAALIGLAIAIYFGR